MASSLYIHTHAHTHTYTHKHMHTYPNESALKKPGVPGLKN